MSASKVIRAPLLLLVLVALVSVSALPTAEASAPAPRDGVLAPTWTQFNLCAWCSIEYTLVSSWFGNTLYSYSVGLRIAGSANANHNIRWAVLYSMGDTETSYTYRWYSGEADWISLEFVTPASPSGSTLKVIFVNGEGTARTMEYTYQGKIIRGGMTRGQPSSLSGQYTLGAYSGLQQIRWVTGLAADTVYIFNVRVTLWYDTDFTQQVAWLFRCYRTTSDPPVPSNVGQSRHHERWGDNAWTNIVWVTRTSGAFCGLWINNWDPNAQTFDYSISWYSAGSATRTLEYNGESQYCVYLAGLSTFDATPIVLPTGRQYIAYARVVLTEGLNGDVDHQTAVYSGLLNTGSGGDGMRNGYQLRYWTDFKSVYNPWIEGITMSSSITYTQDFVVHIRNADTTARTYCFVSSVISF